MAEINLLKDFGLSLADIHRREQLVVADSADMGTAALNNNEVSSKSVMWALFGALAGVSIASVALIMFFRAVLAPAPLPPISIDTAPVDARLTSEAMDGFTRIEEFEFLDDGVAPAVTAAEDAVAEQTALPIVEGSARPETSAEAAVAESIAYLAEDTAPVAATERAPVAAPQYAIQASELSEASYRSLMTAAESRKLKLSSTSRAEELWEVYTPQESSDRIIQGVRVGRSDSFDSKDKAVSFAETLSGMSTVFVVKAEGARHYSVSACCLSYEDAGLLAEKAGLAKDKYSLEKQ